MYQYDSKSNMQSEKSKVNTSVTNKNNVQIGIKPPVQTKSLFSPSGSPNNTGIPLQMKEKFESLSGFSFDDVRVHYNSDKPAQLQALAYTQGNRVYIAPGQEKHLGHELGHVVQQKRGLVQPTVRVNGMPVNDSSVLESNADNMQYRLQDVGSESNEKYAPRLQNVVQCARIYWPVTAADGDKPKDAPEDIKAIPRPSYSWEGSNKNQSLYNNLEAAKTAARKAATWIDTNGEISAQQFGSVANANGKYDYNTNTCGYVANNTPMSVMHDEDPNSKFIYHGTITKTESIGRTQTQKSVPKDSDNIPAIHYHAAKSGEIANIHERGTQPEYTNVGHAHYFIKPEKPSLD